MKSDARSQRFLSFLAVLNYFHTRISVTLCLAAMWFMFPPGSPSLTAEDWLQWRGPLGTGHSNEIGVPTKWSTTENVKWRVELDGEGNSSPIVVGNKVLITHAPAKSNLRGLRCYDRNTGSLLWKHELEYGEKELTHSTNPYCAATPVSDGERVIAFYGSPGLFCYDLDGKVVWQKELGKVEHIWGFGSSPIIYRNLVVLNFGPGLQAFVVALDKNNGSEVWREEYANQKSSKIDEYRGSWSTPVLFQDSGKDLLLLSLPNSLRAVEPLTGKQVWNCSGLGDLVYTSPIIGTDAIISMSGYGGPAIAVRAGGSGDVTATHQLWRQDRNPQRVGSGVVIGDYAYILNETGVVWCLDVKSGAKKWEQRIENGKSWSSMTFVEGKVHVSCMDGSTVVLDVSPEAAKVVAQNKFDELIRSTPAYSNGQIFIRTYKNLYCVQTAS